MQLESLGASELESTTGGNLAPPSWWWVALFVVSESQSFVDGFKAGYNA
jgi:hypothetical protein